MSFVWKAETPLRTPEQVAREVHDVALARGLDEFATVLALMCIAQESGFWCPFNRKDPSSEHYDHDSESNDGRSVGYFQQQNGEPGEDLGDSPENWWGPMGSRMDLKRAADQFLDRLEDNYHRADGSPALASEVISNVQHPRDDLRGEYAKHWDRAWQLVRGLGSAPAPVPPVTPARPGIQPNPAHRGDPVFLPDLLRAWGLDVEEYPDWRDRGHGDFGEIRGVVMHHTGSFGETPHGIAEHPTLGLASQIYLGRDGKVVICGAGIAWHAGDGGGIAWLPDNDANRFTIGVEAANDGGPPPPGRRDAWSERQYDAYTTVCAAICWYLGHDAGRVIMHKTWAGAAQGKWDPGGLELSEVRPDVQAKIDAGPPGGAPGGLTIGDITLTGNDAAIVVAAARKMLAMWDNDDLNRPHAWHSRARCRRDDGPVDDTVGMGLFMDANIYDLLIAWCAVEVGDPFSVETIELGVDGKLPANDPASLAWFRSVDDRITKTARARAHAGLDELKAALKDLEPEGG